jgi:hypothetical protein
MRDQEKAPTYGALPVKRNLTLLFENLSVTLLEEYFTEVHF